MAMRILIADHRSDQVMPLVEFLLSRNLHAVLCRGGGDAVDAIGVQLADRKPFDLVIAHIELPEISGLRVLYEARRLHLGTTVALICPRHLRDQKVERMIAKTGISSVLEPHIDLAQVDRLLKKVAINRQAYQEQLKAKAKARAEAKAQAQAQAKAQVKAQTPAAAPAQVARSAPQRPSLDPFTARSGASGLFFRHDDPHDEDELPPIDGGGPPSAPTGVHQILPPVDEAPSPTMTAKLPPAPKLKPLSGPQPAVGGSSAPPAGPEDPRQRRGLGSGAQKVPTVATGKAQMISAKCFRCGQVFKVKATGGVVSTPCLGCGTINDIRT